MSKATSKKSTTKAAKKPKQRRGEPVALKTPDFLAEQRDQLQGETPIHLVQAARPILILDEPQNMESELRVKAFAKERGG
jgi:restriction endonuclease